MTAYKEIFDNKKKYLSLLLLADEQESMIDTYLERGRLYVMEDDGVRAVCVVTDEGGGILEIKNLAVSPPWHTDEPSSNISGGAIEVPFIRCRSAPATAP